MHQRMRERILAHRTGKCGEQRCRDIVADELDLGLPKDTEQRQAWYDMQKEMWQPWRTAMDQHQWSFQNGKSGGEVDDNNSMMPPISYELSIASQCLTISTSSINSPHIAGSIFLSGRIVLTGCFSRSI